MSYSRASANRDLHNESEISEISHEQDSFFKKDFEKLKGMLTDLKEVTITHQSHIIFFRTRQE